MQLVIFSDIHGNAYALEQMQADLAAHGPTPDGYICLGDTIQGGPEPAQTVALLRDLACPIIMGNADAWMLTGHETGHETVTPAQEEIRRWQLDQLNEADRAFIAAYLPTYEQPLEGGHRLLTFHGSPTSFDEIVLPTTPQEEWAAALGHYAPALLAGGHTHVQYTRRLGPGPAFYFNPGSVGFAYSHHHPDDAFHADPWVEYAILTSTGPRLAIEFRRVPYDPAPYRARILASGRPHAAAHAALYGG